ncbi:hypothetical protein [Thalassobacillus sp. C254]|uniref:hypothetical protein n=1 Tax=Thalassobacillus sp. C254 TaxID=1225341 RepID=UPI0022B68DC6|nr:hypothetical protein [Thalassobacillus sp. C254]
MMEMRKKYRWLYILPFIWIALSILLFITAPDLDQLVREEGQAPVPEAILLP